MVKLKKRITFFFFLIFLSAAPVSPLSFEVEVDVSSDSLEWLEGTLLNLFGKAAKINKQGVEALEKGNYQGAADLFLDALTIYPEYTDAANNLGIAYYYTGAYEQAIAEWKSVFRSDSLYEIAAYNLALIYSQKEESGKAEEWINRAYYLNPKLPTYSILKGIIAYQRDSFTEAVLAWDQALKKSPAEITLYAYSAMAYTKMGHYKKADEMVERGLESNPGSTILILLKAKKTFEKKDYRQTINILKNGQTRDPQIAYAMGLAYFELKDYKNADNSFSRFIKSFPDNPDAYLNLGNTLSRRKKYKKAEQVFRKGLELAPEDLEIAFNLGSMLMAQKKYRDAADIWTNLEESRTTDDPMLLKWIGKSWYHLKDWGKAVEYFERANNAQEDPETMDLLAQCYIRNGKPKEARRVWKALKEKTGGVYNSSELFFRDIEDKDDIRTALEKYGKTKPEDDLGRFKKSVRLARLHALLGDYKKAVKEIRRWEKSKPAVALPLLSSFYRQWGKMESALESLKELKRIKPQYARIHAMTGDLLMEMGRYRDALRELQKEPSPKAVTFYQIGYCLEHIKKYKAAERELRKAVSLEPDLVAARAMLAYVIQESDTARAGEARKLWQEAENMDGNNPDVASNIGLSYYDSKDYTNALSYAQKAVSLAPGRGDFRIQLGNVYLKLKKYEKAVAEYKKAAEKDRKRKCSALNNLAVAYAAKDRWKELKKDLEPFAKECDSLKEMVGLAYYHNKQYEQALSFFRKIPKERMDSLNLYQIVGEIFFHQKKYQKAIQNFLQAQDTSIKFFNLANCYLQLKDGKAALVYARKYGEMATTVKEKMEAELLIGSAYFTDGKTEESIQSYLRAKQINPASYKAPRNLAISYHKAGRFEEGKEMYERAKLLKHDVWKEYKEVPAFYDKWKPGMGKPDSSRYWAQEAYNRAVDFHQTDSLAMAESLYTAAITHDSGFANAWSNIGLIYQKQKKDSLAEHAFLRAVASDSLLPEVYYNLSAFYWTAQDSAAAFEWLKKGLTHCPKDKNLRKLKQDIKIE